MNLVGIIIFYATVVKQFILCFMISSPVKIINNVLNAQIFLFQIFGFSEMIIVRKVERLKSLS